MTSNAWIAGTWRCALVVAVLMGGCVSEPAPTPKVEVELVNQTDIDLRPNFFISSSATTSQELFDEAAFTAFTDRAFPELRAQENVTLMFECNEARSLGTAKASIFDAVTLTRTGTEDVIFLVRESDFNCGDRLQLIYFTQDGALRVRLERPE